MRSKFDNMFDNTKQHKKKKCNFYFQSAISEHKHPSCPS